MTKHVNENYIHSCRESKVTLETMTCGITDMGFDDEELVHILRFYLFEAPVLKADKSSSFGLKSLKEYGWNGSSRTSKLEGQLCECANMTNFYFIKSDAIDETIKAMNLEGKICIEHPRAVLKQNVKAVIYEDGTTEVRQQETRLECLFRHIRNSLAHNCTYDFRNGNIMLEDSDDNGKISARIIIPKIALSQWIEIIKKGVSK